MTVNAIPDGYQTITPYLIVDGAAALIVFLKAAFDGEVIRMTQGPGDQPAIATSVTQKCGSVVQ